MNVSALHTPLIVRTTVTHGISLFDANESSLAFDFERHTANEIARRCNGYDALLAQRDALREALEVAASIFEAPANRFGKLEFYEDAARAARERLLAMAQHYHVSASSTIPEQAGKVMRAVLKAAQVQP
jgi:hypothetical protein